MPDKYNMVDTETLQNLLIIFRDRLNYALHQKGMLGLVYTPYHITNDINETRDNIQKIKSVLRSRKILVIDYPHEEEDEPIDAKFAPYEFILYTFSKIDNYFNQSNRIIERERVVLKEIGLLCQQPITLDNTTKILSKLIETEYFFRDTWQLPTELLSLLTQCTAIVSGESRSNSEEINPLLNKVDIFLDAGLDLTFNASICFIATRNHLLHAKGDFEVLRNRFAIIRRLLEEEQIERLRRFLEDAKLHSRRVTTGKFKYYQDKIQQIDIQIQKDEQYFKEFEESIEQAFDSFERARKLVANAQGAFHDAKKSLQTFLDLTETKNKLHLEEVQQIIDFIQENAGQLPTHEFQRLFVRIQFLLAQIHPYIPEQVQPLLEMSNRLLIEAKRQNNTEISSVFPHLNTRFEGLASNQFLPVGKRTLLIVSVGGLLENNRSQSSRPFTFSFPKNVTEVSFTVHVHADPEAWIIKIAEPIMIIVAPGETRQEAEFLITPRLPGSDKLYITVEQTSGAVVQHIWLPVEAASDTVMATDITISPSTAPQITTQSKDNFLGRAVEPLDIGKRLEVTFPIYSLDIERHTVQIVIYPGRDSSTFMLTVNAYLPDERIIATYNIPTSAVEIQNATLRLRQELEKIVFYSDADAKGTYPFANNNSLTINDRLAREAALPLADAGRQVWSMLFNAPRTPTELREFAAAMRSMPCGSTFQVVIDSQQFIVPWGLLYDNPGPITTETLEWSGFWGYRYIISVLPPGHYPSPVIDDNPFNILALFNDDEKLREFTNAQEQFFRHELGIANTNIYWGTSAVKEALSSSSAATLIYCYCHGSHRSGLIKAGTLASESSLIFSPKENIRLDDLRWTPIKSFGKRPLVFLNSCEGATQDAFYYDGYMPFFIEEQGACGFIGTEVKAPQLLAHDLILRFLRLFAQGHTVGEILWRLRQYYLDTHHNILAFNYGLYGLKEIRLPKPLYQTGKLIDDSLDAID